MAAVGAFLQRSEVGVRPQDEIAARPEGPADPVTRSTPDIPADPGAEVPRVVSLGPDHVEMRSGPVRLILFQEPTQKN